jgi:hypothetical protein
MIALTTFTCPRSCRWAEREDRCRFTPMLSSMGVIETVTSHTRTVRVEYRSIAALEAAVRALGWRWLGHGQHSLFQGRETGHGIHIPGWMYPIVLRADRSLALDDYGGKWGTPADLDRLATEYRCQAALEAAAMLGWAAERHGNDVTVFHPSGGTLTVSAGGIETSGFVGCGCHVAADQLAEFLGSTVESVAKPEMYQQHQQVQEGIV